MRKSISYIHAHLIAFYGIPRRSNKVQTPLDVLIGTILSQNTNDKNSYKAFLALKAISNNWLEIAKLRQQEIEKIIAVAGLAKQKAAAISTVLALHQKDEKIFDRKAMQQRDDEELMNLLCSIDGVGKKTASCVMLFSLHKNYCPVDTHVHRILNRFGVVNTKIPEKTFDLIHPYLPENAAHTFHTNLIRFGREVCKSQSPLCAACPLKRKCAYTEKNLHSQKVVKENSFMLLDNLH